MYSQGVTKRDVRLFAESIDELFADNAPGIYIVPGAYFGFEAVKLSNDTVVPGKLGDYPYTSVIQKVIDAFEVNPQATIDESTTLLIVPDHWDKRLPDSGLRFASQLSFIPFSLVLHKNVTTAKELKTLVPPKNAYDIMRKDELLGKLQTGDMLMSVPGSAYGKLTAPYNSYIPDRFQNFNFTNQPRHNGVSAASRSGRRTRSKKSGMKTRGQNSRSNKRNKNSSRSKNSRSKTNSRSKKNSRSKTNSRSKKNSKMSHKKSIRKTYGNRSSKAGRIRSYQTVMNAFKNQAASYSGK